MSDARRLTDLQPEANFLERQSVCWKPGGLSRPEDLASILYTSGTTGGPQGVQLRHKAILSAVRPTIVRGGLLPGDRVVSSLPLFRVAGLFIRALPTLGSGSALLLMETFQSGELIEPLRRWQPNGLHLRPPQVGALLSHQEFTAELLERIRRRGGRNA